MKEVDYCKCENSSSLYSRNNEFGQWDVCSDCEKPIEDTYEYFNSCEGDY